jgi:hypothetical protein
VATASAARAEMAGCAWEGRQPWTADGDVATAVCPGLISSARAFVRGGTRRRVASSVATRGMAVWGRSAPGQTDRRSLGTSLGTQFDVRIFWAGLRNTSSEDGDWALSL